MGAKPLRWVAHFAAVRPEHAPVQPSLTGNRVEAEAGRGEEMPYGQNGLLLGHGMSLGAPVRLEQAGYSIADVAAAFGVRGDNAPVVRHL